MVDVVGQKEDVRSTTGLCKLWPSIVQSTLVLLRAQVQLATLPPVVVLVADLSTPSYDLTTFGAVLLQHYFDPHCTCDLDSFTTFLMILLVVANLDTALLLFTVSSVALQPKQMFLNISYSINWGGSAKFETLSKLFDFYVI